MINGIINVYKEVGYTSRDAVSRLTGILRQRKIGHTGTLDPAAEGVKQLNYVNCLQTIRSSILR